jgi:hypothetical protein
MAAAHYQPEEPVAVAVTLKDQFVPPEDGELG